MNDMKNVMTQAKYDKDRDQAVFLGWMVYGGVVVAVTTLFISFVLTAFPPNAYATRIIMTVAGAIVGLSMIAFPYALHKWAVEPDHRKWTVTLYYGEIVFVAVNTFVSFVTLLAKNAGYAAPEWAVLYEPFSILAIVYTLIAWGTVFLKDPRHKSTVKGLQALQTFDDQVADMLVKYVNSPRGADRVAQVAEDRIGKLFEDKNGNGIPDVFERTRTSVRENEDVRQPDEFTLTREQAAALKMLTAEGRGGVSANGNGHADPTKAAR
jgi:hypothetical protein